MQAKEYDATRQDREHDEAHERKKFEAGSRHKSLFSVWNIAYSRVYTDVFAVLVSAHLKTWISACEELPSTFLRLVCVAKQRRSDSVRERAPEFTETNALLGKYHRRVFRLWLALSLSDKVDDTMPYLTTLAGLEDELTWPAVERFISSLIPPGVSKMETSLFINHLRGIFDIFCE
jgi:hypothetical protein